MQALHTFVPAVFQYTLKLLDLTGQMLDLLAGTARGADGKAGGLISAAVGRSAFSRVFWAATLVTLIICAVFSVLSAMRDPVRFKGKRGAVRLMIGTGKDMLMFLAAPFAVIIFINLSSSALTGFGETIETAAGQSGGTLGTHVFLTVAVDNYKDGVNAEVVRNQFLAKEKDYMDISHIESVTDIAVMEYGLGTVAALAACVTLLIACLMFLRRMFELAVLYIAAPTIVPSISLDNGSKLKRWRELFAAKAVSAFAAVFAAKLYTILLMIFAGENGVPNIILRLAFICVGGFAVIKLSAMAGRALNLPSPAKKRRTERLMDAAIAYVCADLGHVCGDARNVRKKETADVALPGSDVKIWSQPKKPIRRETVKSLPPFESYARRPD